MGWFLSHGTEKVPSNGIDALPYEDAETSSVIALTYPFLETRGGEKLMTCPCHRASLGITSDAKGSLQNKSP